MKSSKIIPITLSVAIFVGIVVYGLFRFYFLLSGPQITIISPLNGDNIDSDVALLQVETKRASELYVNGLPVLIDKDEITDIPLYLSNGGTNISVVVKDAYGTTRNKALFVTKKGV